MRECTWRGGCAVTIASDEKQCSYHTKISDGHITTTRSESGGGKGAVPVGVVTVDQAASISLTTREREAADRVQQDYQHLLRQVGATEEPL